MKVLHMKNIQKILPLCVIHKLFFLYLRCETINKERKKERNETFSLYPLYNRVK